MLGSSPHLFNYMITLSRSLFIGIFIIWQLANIIYIDNLGNLSQSLPQNIISWLAMVAIISIVFFTIFYQKNKIILTVPATCFFIALLIFSINLIYTKKEDINLAFWYLSGITVGVSLYISGLQIKNKWLIQSFCIYCYIVISGAQSLFTFYQYIFESAIFHLAADMHSKGLSQQVNTLSVSMVTACLLSIMTLVLSQFSLVSKHYEKIRVILLGILIFTFTLVTVVLQSIIAWLCLFSSVFILICLFYRKNRLRINISCFIIITAILTGTFFIINIPSHIELSMINQFHLKQMLRFSITVFLEQAYNIWDPSLLQDDSYEEVTLPFLISQNYITPHLHNEIFLWITKDNYINLVGISLLITGGIYIIFQSFIKYKLNGNGYSLAMVISITPILINSSIEYPFILSVFHWGIFILFLSFTDSAFTLEKQFIFYINNKTSYLFSFIILIIGFDIFSVGIFLFNN